MFILVLGSSSYYLDLDCIKCAATSSYLYYYFHCSLCRQGMMVYLEWLDSRFTDEIAEMLDRRVTPGKAGGPRID
jgi:hypothetical protein